ncbi:hypothetical protein GF319_04420 [Candidatus Bathyarchaeota archaeon]|nr:hypothetical protein [Candidatus Bathyarchaeota archaeon]
MFFSSSIFTLNFKTTSATETSAVWVLSSTEDTKTTDPQVSFKISGNNVEITRTWDSGWGEGSSTSKHVLPNLPQELTPGRALSLQLIAETAEFIDPIDFYGPAYPDWTNTSMSAETIMEVERFKQWYISEYEAYKVSTAWWSLRDAPGARDDVRRHEYQGETAIKQHTWQIWDTAFQQDVLTELRVYVTCSHDEGRVWFTRKYTYTLQRLVSEGVRPSIEKVKIIEPAVNLEHLEESESVITPDCRGLSELRIGVWIRDLQDTSDFNITVTSGNYPFIIRTNRIETIELGEWVEEGSTKRVYFLPYDVLIDVSQDYPKNFTIAVSLKAHVREGDGTETSYTSPSKELEVKVQSPEPMKFKFTSSESKKTVNLLQPIYFNLSFSYENELGPIHDLGYSDKESDVIYQSDIELFEVKNNGTVTRKPVKFKIVNFTPEETVAIANTESATSNKIQFQVFNGKDTIKLKIELDNKEYKYWPDNYTIEIDLKFQRISELNVLSRYEMDGKEADTTLGDMTIPSISRSVEVQIDPEIREEIRQYLAERWYKRIKELDERSNKDTISSINEMYDLLDEKEEYINLYAAFTELTLSLHHTGPGIFQPGDLIDQLEDVLDLGKIVWLEANGYYVEGLGDLVFKLGPDMLCDGLGAYLKTSAMIAGPAAGAGIGFAVGGPFGGAVGGIIGYFAGVKGADAVEGVCEVGGAFLENWWSRNKEYYGQKLGFEVRNNILKWDKKGRPFYDENDAKLWGITQYKSDGYVHIYDSQGRHVGPTESGEYESEIPGSVYIHLQDEKTTLFCLGMYSNPLDEYEFKVECTDSGHYDLLLTSASREEVSTLIDLENEAMAEGDIFTNTIDTSNLWDNLDLVPPEIVDVRLSNSVFTNIEAPPSITVNVSDNYGVYRVVGVLLKNDFPISYLSLIREYDGEYWGRLPHTEGFLNGDYLLEVQAYDYQNNIASKTIPVTVDIDAPNVGFFEVTDLEIQPRRASLGEIVIISGKIMNGGDTRGTNEVSLVINGAVLATKLVELDPGESETLSWKTTNEWSEGTYEVSLGALSETFEIVEESETTISIYLQPTEIHQGDYTTISGYISPVPDDGRVRIFIRLGVGDWLELGEVEVEQDGFYSYQWSPSLLGTFQVITVLLDDNGDEFLPSSTETVLVEEESSGGIPGYPVSSIALGLISVITVYHLGRRKGKNLFFQIS